MAERHFYEQRAFAESYLIPFFRRQFSNFDRFNVLVVGCAEAGFVDALYREEIQVLGIELEPHRVAIASKKNSGLEVMVGDITDADLIRKIDRRFDLVVMRDTIEHIPDKKGALENVCRLLKNDGFLYVTFPPRYSAFGGHQQNGRSLLRYVPWLHYWPHGCIRWLGRIFNERSTLIDEVIRNSKIGLSIHAFMMLYKASGFKPLVKSIYLLRPIYNLRFRLPALRVPNIPFIREVSALGCEYLLQKCRE